MKIFITSDNTTVIWNTDILNLEDYQKNVIMINMTHSKPIQYNFNTIDVPYTNVVLGQSGYGVNSIKYKALLSVSDKVKQYVSYNEDILILSGSDPQTLYIFKVLQNISYQLPLKLHLWALLPFTFEGKRRKNICKDLLSDLSNVKSLILFDSDDYLKELDRKTTMAETFLFITKSFNSLLPQVIDEIKHMDTNCKYFFDTSTRHYVNIQNNPLTFDYNKNLQETILYNEPKINGKEICDKLRQMRIDFAEANNINFTSEPCQYNGPCCGTCEKCEQELAYLNKQSQKLDTIIYPHYEIKEDYKYSVLKNNINTPEFRGILRRRK